MQDDLALPDEALDIQHDPDPEPDHPGAHHIPHIGHAVLFFSLAALCILLAALLVGTTLHINTPEQAAAHPLANLIANTLGYAATLLAATRLFTILWQKPFWGVISWNIRQARRRWWQLLLAGIVLSALAQASEHLMKQPVDTTVERLLTHASSAWLLTLVGTFFFPIMEEIAFRGFLLPALATAYDWLALDRTPAGLREWEQSSRHTRNGWIFATVFSSIIFALLHGEQLHGAAGPIAVLFVVSVVFSAVRIRTRSVAASSLVHMAYDGLIFLELLFASGGFRHLDKLR